MSRLLASTTIACLWLAATLFGAPTDGQFVLCHGADGHVALEPVHVASCSGGLVTADLAEVGIITDADCTDVPANHHPAHQTGNRLKDNAGGKRQSAPLWSSAFRADLLGNVLSILDGSGTPGMIQPPLHLALLQTVVLRL